MYTTIIHPLRKMYCLSINEYSILEAVRNLSNNRKYDGWCVLSIPKMALALDLSASTIQRVYKKLEEKNLVERRWQTDSDTAVRPLDEWNEWFMPEKAEMILAMKTTNKELVGHIKNPYDTTPVKMTPPPGQNDTPTPVKMTPNINKDTYSDTTLSKDNEPVAYGNEDINKMLLALKGRIGIEAFADSTKWERIYAKHCCVLLEKIGSQEFSRRLDIILSDSFKQKNCNKIRYVYEQVKGFIEPINSIKSF